MTGGAVRSVEGAAHWMLSLLRNPRLIRTMGEAGRGHVRQNLMVTREPRDDPSLPVHVTR